MMIVALKSIDVLTLLTSNLQFVSTGTSAEYVLMTELEVQSMERPKLHRVESMEKGHMFPI